jgi:hypothetical protein
MTGSRSQSDTATIELTVARPAAREVVHRLDAVCVALRTVELIRVGVVIAPLPGLLTASARVQLRGALLADDPLMGQPVADEARGVAVDVDDGGVTVAPDPPDARPADAPARSGQGAGLCLTEVVGRVELDSCHVMISILIP